MRWASYCGGSGDDESHGLAVSGSGDVYIVGMTYSSDFPVSAGANQGALAGGGDSFVAKFSSSGFYQWSSYFGGTANEYAECAAIDASGNLVMAGYTSSSDFPASAGAFQSWQSGGEDCFGVKWASSGAVLWASYYGGSGNDRAHGCAIDPLGRIILSGRTESADFPVYNAAQGGHAGGELDAFVMQLDQNGLIPGINFPPIAMVSASPIQGGAPLTVDFSSVGSYDPDGLIVTYLWDFDDGNVSSQQNPTHTYTSNGTYDALLTVTDNVNTTASAVVTISVEALNSYIYVANQVVYRVNDNRNKWFGTDLVTIRNDADQPVIGALVTATYSGPNSGTVSGSTDANGNALLSTAVKNNPAGLWCFTVTDVQYTGTPYNASNNVVTTACESSPKASARSCPAIDAAAAPNPFYRMTQIRFSLPLDAECELQLLDRLGRVVSTPVSGFLEAGPHTAAFDCRDLPSGTYFYRIRAGEDVRYGKLLLLR